MQNVNRERWQPFPVRCAEDRLFLKLLALLGRRDEAEVTAIAPDGARKKLHLRRSIAVEEPAGETGDVVCRVEFVGSGPGEDDRLEENLWELAARFLDQTAARARREMERTVALPKGELPRGLLRVVTVTFGGETHRFRLP